MTDLRIPRFTDIIVRALDIRESAVRMHDEATARQIDRLIAKLPGARMTWQLGTLIVRSPSGGTYRVSRAGCDCLNAQRSHAARCWHWALYNLLLDMLDTEAESADAACDPPGDNPLGDDEGDTLPSARALGLRLSAARSVVYAGHWIA